MLTAPSKSVDNHNTATDQAHLGPPAETPGKAAALLSVCHSLKFRMLPLIGCCSVVDVPAAQDEGVDENTTDSSGKAAALLCSVLCARF